MFPLESFGLDVCFFFPALSQIIWVTIPLVASHIIHLIFPKAQSGRVSLLFFVHPLPFFLSRLDMGKPKCFQT